MNSNRDHVRDLLLDGLSVEEIAYRMPSLSASSVRRYATSVRAEFTPAQRDAISRKIVARRATDASRDPPRLSDLHARVGRRLALFRIEEGLQPAEFATKFGLGNRLTIPLMENGQYDFKLSELLFICSLLRINPSYFIGDDQA